MAVTKDQHIERYGVGDPQPYNQPIGASVTVYRGTIAVTDGTTGYLKNPDTAVTATDIVWGLIQQCGPETIDSGPGIANASSVSGVVTADIATGTFFLACDTTLTQANIGAKVYVKDAITVSLTSTSRPLAGILVAIETRSQAPGNYAISLGGGITGPVEGP
jgi:hypothetical protein